MSSRQGHTFSHFALKIEQVSNSKEDYVLLDKIMLRILLEKKTKHNKTKKQKGSWISVSIDGLSTVCIHQAYLKGSKFIYCVHT